MEEHKEEKQEEDPFKRNSNDESIDF